MLPFDVMRLRSTCLAMEQIFTVSAIQMPNILDQAQPAHFANTGYSHAKSHRQDWTTIDVNNLCTSDCVASLDSWGSNVEAVCADETTIQAGVIVQAKALPMTFTYNAGLVCMQDSASNWCFMESQSWQGSDYIRYDPTMCFSDGDDNSTIAAECADDDFDLDTITANMSAMTNLYDSNLVRGS